MALVKLNARSATALDATVLTGNLPAISGASLTGISAGKVAQVIHATSSGSIDIDSSSSFADMNLEGVITPSATSSKVLVMFSPRATLAWQSGTRAFGVSIERAISGGATSNVFSSAYNYEVGGSGARTNGTTYLRPQWMKLDSPNSSAEITYNIQIKTESSGSVQFNGLNMKSDLILMEVLA